MAAYEPRLLAIDPGNKESGVVLIDSGSYRPLDCGKLPNSAVESYLAITGEFDEVVIEMVASYGMPVGATIFDTCVAIGRFERILDSRQIDHGRLFRRQVKHNLCGRISSKDKDVVSALTARFAPGEANMGKGTKSMPGWFYGFKSDIWQAYALGVTCLDMQSRGEWV